MEAAPGAAFEVVEADLTFEILIVAFHAPAKLRHANKGPKAEVGGQGREVKLRLPVAYKTLSWLTERYPDDPHAEKARRRTLG